MWGAQHPKLRSQPSAADQPQGTQPRRRLPPAPGQAPSMTSAPVSRGQVPRDQAGIPTGAPPSLATGWRPHSEREWEMSDQHLGSDQMEFSVCDGSDVSTRSGEARCSGPFPDRRPQCWLPATRSARDSGARVMGTRRGHACTAGAAAHTHAGPSAGSTALAAPSPARPLQPPPQNDLPTGMLCPRTCSPRALRPPKASPLLETPSSQSSGSEACQGDPGHLPALAGTAGRGPGSAVLCGPRPAPCAGEWPRGAGSLAQPQASPVRGGRAECHQSVPSALQQGLSSTPRCTASEGTERCRGLEPGPSTPCPTPRPAAPAAGPGHGLSARGREHQPGHNAAPRCPSPPGQECHAWPWASRPPCRPRGSRPHQSHAQTAGAHAPPPPPTPAIPGTAASAPLPADPECCPAHSTPPRATTVHSQAEESPAAL